MIKKAVTNKAAQDKTTKDSAAKDKNPLPSSKKSIDYIFEDNIPYPTVRLDEVTLPIEIRYSGWIEVLFISALSLFIFSFSNGMRGQDLLSFHPTSIITDAVFFAMLAFWLVNIHRLMFPRFLLIDQDGIKYRKEWFNLTHFQAIGFDKIYGAYYTFEHNGNGGKRCYLNLALVDGHLQAMKKLTKDNHLKINIYKNEEEAIAVTAITKALMTDYHQRHGLSDTLPVLKVIEQKPVKDIF